MRKFPIKESEIIALAQTISAGLAANATTFPAPPVTVTDLNAHITDYITSRDAVTAAEANLKTMHSDKDSHLSELVQRMKDEISYAEMLAHNDDAILNLIGWSNRAQPTALQPPGQCRALEIIDQGAGWVRIDWKEPVDGGKPAAYKVQRSEDAGNFTDVATAVESEAILLNQPTMKTLSYKVRAVNKAGEGMESNTISIIL